MDIAFVISLFAWIIGISLASGTALVFVFSIYNKAFCRRCTSKSSLKGKTIIITGASAGIGKEAARDFAERGGRIILACRNLTKAKNIADQIISSTGNSNVIVKLLDTSLMSSVRAFAKEILKLESQLDVLVLNAGIGASKLRKNVTTSEGLEMTMATNHFGHFLLVNLLLGLLVKSKPSRVIFTSSQAHKAIYKLDADNINFNKGGYSSLKGYGLSKLCNVICARYLAIQAYKQGVTFNSFCPGVVQTEIYNKTGGFFSSSLFRIILSLAARSAKDGAQTLIYLAVAEEVENVSGAHFMDCQERLVSEFANDAGLLKKVWEKSADLVQLTPKERLF